MFSNLVEREARSLTKDLYGFLFLIVVGCAVKCVMHFSLQKVASGCSKSILRAGAIFIVTLINQYSGGFSR